MSPKKHLSQFVPLIHSAKDKIYHIALNSNVYEPQFLFYKETKFRLVWLGLGYVRLGSDSSMVTYTISLPCVRVWWG